jgi:hypothetical protein
MRPLHSLFAAALLVIALLAGGARAEPVDLELVLAADGSGSIDDEELKLQREGYAVAITDPRVLSAIASGPLQRIALAYIEWGGPRSQHTIVDWAVIGDPASATAFAQELRTRPRQAQGYNSISGAIDYARGLLATNAHVGARQVIDVSGDGPQIGGRPVEMARDEAVQAGITINALVIASPGGGYRGPGGIPLDEHYRRDVIGGFGAFVMTVEDRAEFAAAILNKLIEEIADRRRPPTLADRS